MTKCNWDNLRTLLGFMSEVASETRAAAELHEDFGIILKNVAKTNKAKKTLTLEGIIEMRNILRQIDDELGTASKAEK